MDRELKYMCPECSSDLSRNGTIMLTMTRSNGEKTNLILDPQPGVYGYSCTPPLTLEDGELVDCYCPYCWESLQSEKYPNFVRLVLKCPENEDCEMLFSRLVGEHKTYLINDDFVKEYGDGSKSLLDTAQ